MPMLARVVALLIVEGGVGGDVEECATTFLTRFFHETPIK
jgi:hypothetical protein